MATNNPEQKNYLEIERLERLLAELQRDPATAREPAAIREIGLEIALAIREVGAMLVNVGWEQSYKSPRPGATGESLFRGRSNSRRDRAPFALLRWGFHRACTWSAQRLPSTVRELVEGGVFYGDRNSQVVQRFQGVRLHHP